MVALRNLAAYGKGQKDVLETIMTMAEDKHTLVQISAVNALGDLKDERAVPLLEKLTKGDQDGRVERAAEDAIKTIYPWLEGDMESYRLGEELKKKSEKKG